VSSVLYEQTACSPSYSTTGKADAGGRDLLSLLVRANLSEDAAHRLSDDEVLARTCQPFPRPTSPSFLKRATEIPTFILAGHESPSTAISWTLFELAQNVEIQSQLRAELRTLPLPTAATNNAPLDADTLAALDKMPLLDAVVRESLRVYAPVQNVGRMATEDAAIPLDRPFLSRHGRMQDQIRLKKGDLITVPVGAVHRNPEIWGADADAWKYVTRVAARSWLTRAAGRNVGSSVCRRRPKPFQECGVTYSRSSAAHTHASASVSRFSSECCFFSVTSYLAPVLLPRSRLRPIAHVPRSLMCLHEQNKDPLARACRWPPLRARCSRGRNWAACRRCHATRLGELACKGHPSPTARHGRVGISLCLLWRWCEKCGMGQEAACLLSDRKAAAPDVCCVRRLSLSAPWLMHRCARARQASARDMKRRARPDVVQWVRISKAQTMWVRRKVRS
jgi:hypothetical protein